MTTLPPSFEAYTRQLMGPELYARLERGLTEEPTTSIRLNPFKAMLTPATIEAMAEQGQALPIPWCAEGCYLDSRPNFTFDPLFHAGLYYVQEASSMFVAHVLRQLIHTPVLMLDLCAAPGGKTTAARAALPEGSLLFANEPTRLRASVLSENVQKFGHPDMVVTHNFPADYQKSGMIFDVVLADVPCSGEGMFRKDATAIDEWSPQHVEKCRQLQRSIIEDIWPCLAEGGLLIYSTCTFNAHEDEENANWIAETLGADFIAIDTHKEWNITGSLTDGHPMYRFIPGKTRGEGLFMAVLRKHGSAANALDTALATTKRTSRKRHQDKGKSQKNNDTTTLVAQWLNGQFMVSNHGGHLVAIPQHWHAIYEEAYNKLHILHAGVGLGWEKGKDLVPDASLALSIRCNKHAFPRTEVSYADAIRFLRKEAVTLPLDTPRGLVVLTYHGHALGFVKNIGNRANNLYPQEWKVKSSHLPDFPPHVLPISRSFALPHED